MIIKRELGKKLLESAKHSPALAVLGPRQSGKTTLVKLVFSDYKYVSLEDLDLRKFAQDDPRGFFDTYYKGVKGLILDEIQNVPELLSYIQGLIDQDQRPGAFVLTGSQNLLTNQAVSQTLAGRVALFTLLPLSIRELKQAKLLPDLDRLLYQGFYPVIYSRKVDPSKWYADYTRTYLERDVRAITQVGDLGTFKRFLQLCAGRVGQVLNIASLANDVGVSPNTVRSWISILEASYIIFFLLPFYKNFNKRLVKSPKLFFYDVGLVCSLLGIEDEEMLFSHYLRGGLFENMVLSEFLKADYNIGRDSKMYFWRDKTGHEVDCILDKKIVTPVEIKIGKTINSSFFDGLNYWNKLSGGDSRHSFVVYGGDENLKSSHGEIISWKDME